MSVLELLPQSEGWLPSWLFFVSIVSVANSVQAYSTTAYTRQVYEGSPGSVTHLSARTFGTWTLLSSVIRIYAAYYIHDIAVYQLALATYAIAWLHFVSEWLVFGTARWGKGLAGPVIVSTASLTWMLTQWDFYLGK